MSVPSAPLTSEQGSVLRSAQSSGTSDANPAVGESLDSTDFPQKEPGDLSFPKSSRILKSSDYRKVYDQGKRMTCPYFAVFVFSPADLATGPLFGFTTPRALGKAVVRNRIRRRVKEAVRLERHSFGSGWMIVFNPRRACLEAPFQDIRREVAKVASRCK